VWRGGVYCFTRVTLNLFSTISSQRSNRVSCMCTTDVPLGREFCDAVCAAQLSACMSRTCAMPRVRAMHEEVWRRGGSNCQLARALEAVHALELHVRPQEWRELVPLRHGRVHDTSPRDAHQMHMQSQKQPGLVPRRHVCVRDTSPREAQQMCIVCMHVCTMRCNSYDPFVML
jgi:hypothetical protein